MRDHPLKKDVISATSAPNGIRELSISRITAGPTPAKGPSHVKFVTRDFEDSTTAKHIKLYILESKIMSVMAPSMDKSGDVIGDSPDYHPSSVTRGV